MITLFSTALALTCTGAEHPDLCPAVEAMALSINAQASANIVREGGPARLDPDTLYTRLLTLQTQLDNAGCSVDGWAAGSYGAPIEEWTGEFDDGLTGTWSGTYDRASRTFAGDWNDSVSSGQAGDRWSGYNLGGQAISNLDDTGAFAGVWVRTSGSRGVYMMLQAACDGSPVDAVDPWYVGTPTITETPTSTSLVTIRYTGDDTSALWVDGVSIAANPSNAAFEWGTVSTHILELESGAHTVAASVVDTGGGGVMFQFLAEDSSGAPLLSSSDTGDWLTAAAPASSFPGFELATFVPNASWFVPNKCGDPILPPWNGFTGTGTSYIWPSACSAATPRALFRGTIVIP